MILGQILAAWLYGHIFEYIAHRYVLHNSKTFKKQFKQHFGQHHAVSRKNNMYDEGYESLISSDFEFYSLFLVFYSPSTNSLVFSLRLCYAGVLSVFVLFFAQESPHRCGVG